MSDVTVELVQRRRRLSREEAERLVRENEASGLTRQVFCAGRGLSVAALDRYRRRARGLVGATKLDGGRFHWLESNTMTPKIVLSQEELALRVGGINLVETRPGQWHRQPLTEALRESPKTALTLHAPPF